MQSKISLFILLCLVTLLTCQSFRVALLYNHKANKQHIAHSNYILAEIKHHKHLFRHNLNKHAGGLYQQAALQTNHYSFNLNIKVNGINYKMNIDTGSADIFIKGQTARGVPQNRYKSGQNFNRKPAIYLRYLDGQVITYETILNLQFNNRTFNTPLLIAYNVPRQLEDVQGIIGLSYPQLARHQPTFIQTLIKNKIIFKNAYGMNLNLIVQNRSFISFGQPDTQLFQGSLKYYQLPNTSAIVIKFNSIKFGNSQQMVLSKALLDTGNTCITIPQKYQQQILKVFNTRSNRCAFIIQQYAPAFSLLSCRIQNFNQLPTLTLKINTDVYTIEKEFYLQKCVQNPRQIRIKPNMYWCNTNIQSTTINQSQRIILGAAFFNRFYTFFDLENKKVGIAKNKQKITLQDIRKVDNIFITADWKQLKNIIQKKVTPQKSTNSLLSF